MSGGTPETSSEDYTAINDKIDKGGQEMGKGFSDVVYGTTKALKEAMCSARYLAKSGFTKICEKCCDKDDEEKREAKANKAKAHLKVAKSKAQKSLSFTKGAVKGGYHAAKGTVKVGVYSVDKAVKSMRSKKSTTNETPESQNPNQPETENKAA